MYCHISLNIYQKWTSNSYTSLEDSHYTPHIHFCNKTAFMTVGPLPFIWRSSKLLMWPLDLMSSFSRNYTFGMEQLGPKLHSDNFWYPQSASHTHTHMMYPFFLMFYACILCRVSYYILNLFTDLISCIFLPRQRSDMKSGDHHPADLLSAPSVTYP